MKDLGRLLDGQGDELEQDTEASIGPYSLQDFNLFYTLRYGMRPSKIGFLAWHAWRDARRFLTLRRSAGRAAELRARQAELDKELATRVYNVPSPLAATVVTGARVCVPT